ncbi:hypothetical protein SLEP1_g39452 [Rubroshorea leprosula]|uniref:Uncharacterized protein n=1 Tax=Rubroshorea leprosula TaxID=152421 RepID=A0AAV5L0N0_9ROSI|nr:hypothetical protein SLEP1_g39452 [Rubroshorea leprosula]
MGCLIPSPRLTNPPILVNFYIDFGDLSHLIWIDESRLLKAAADSDEMEVQRAGSGSCSRLYSRLSRKTEWAANPNSRLWKYKPALLTILQLELCVLQSIYLLPTAIFEQGAINIVVSDLGGVLIPSRVICREDLWGLSCKEVRFERNTLILVKGLSGSFKPPLLLLVKSVEEILVKASSSSLICDLHLYFSKNAIFT